jgi:hypothetical protein
MQRLVGHERPPKYQYMALCVAADVSWYIEGMLGWVCRKTNLFLCEVELGRVALFIYLPFILN